jgi:Zn-dependent oligopeptidase
VAEGARLESVYTFTGIGGSNPSLSASTSDLSRNSLLKTPLQTPFDSIENAHDYVRLLGEAIAEAKSEIEAGLAEAAKTKSERRVQALQIVQFKLNKLEQHLKTSSRLLNDLRSLRRLLLEERLEHATESLETPYEE